MRKAVLVLGLFLAAANGPASAQSPEDWANKLFLPITSHDFGMVPKGAQLKYSFKMTNIYKVPLEISQPRVSCGCVSTTLPKKLLQPGEVSSVEIVMDSRRFSGPKTVSVFVTVGPQYVSTATLRVTANARQDVVLNPGEINFGVVPRGQKMTQSIDVEYSGNYDWRIQEVVKNANAPFTVTAEELYRRPPRTFPKKAGEVGYRLNVTLKADAPASPFKEELILKTNDPANQVFQVAVEGNIQASLNVSPSLVNLGSVIIGEDQTHKVVVRGSRPFRIIGISGHGEGISADVPTGAANIHVLVVHCKPGRPGEVRKQLQIRTDLDGETVNVTVEAIALPKESGDPVAEADASGSDTP
jgi:hypothetical protein